MSFGSNLLHKFLFGEPEPERPVDDDPLYSKGRCWSNALVALEDTRYALNRPKVDLRVLKIGSESNERWEDGLAHTIAAVRNKDGTYSLYHLEEKNGGVVIVPSDERQTFEAIVQEWGGDPSLSSVSEPIGKGVLHDVRETTLKQFGKNGDSHMMLTERELRRRGG